MYCKYSIKSKVIKTTTDSGYNFVKAFSVFDPSKDDLDVCAIDASDILSIDLNSQLPPHHKCAAHLFAQLTPLLQSKAINKKKLAEELLPNVKLYGIKQPEVFLQLTSWKRKLGAA